MSVLPTRLNIMPREASPASPPQVNPPSLATPEELAASSHESTTSPSDTFESGNTDASAVNQKKESWFLPTAAATLGSFVGSVMLVGEEVGFARKLLAPAIGATFGVLGTLLAMGKLKKKTPTSSPNSTQA